MNDSIEGELRWFGHILPTDLKELKLVAIGDLHHGNPLSSVKHLDRTLELVSNLNAYIILTGDLCESSLRTSKGDIYRQVGTPQEQRDWVLNKLYPFKDHILGQVSGNHENRIYNETGIDISKDIAESLGVPYRAEGLLLKISFGDNNNRTKGKPYTYWVYATHGYGGARTKSAKAIKVERLATWIDADIYFMSHDHVVNVAPDVYLKPDNRGTMKDGFLTGKVTAHRKVLIKTNAFLKWGGYSEMLGFPPVDLESPIVTLSGEGIPRVRVEV